MIERDILLAGQGDAPHEPPVGSADNRPAAQGIEAIRQGVIAALQTVYDPEIPVNIYELGLIYRCDVDENGTVAIQMTLTTPGCPVAGTMPGLVKAAAEGAEGVAAVTVDLVWDPPWDRSMMGEAARLELGLY
jgi:FeS assembly SUF system protein